MKPRIEYVFECGCQRKDFAKKYFRTANGTSTRLICPSCGEFLHHKIGWCVDCGKEVTIKAQHNNFKRCKECAALRKKQIAHVAPRNPRPLKVHQEPVVVERISVPFNPFMPIPVAYLAGLVDGQPLAFVLGVDHG